MLRFGLVILLLLASSLWSSQQPIICASEEWEGYTNRDGTGFYWDLIRTIYDKHGLTIQTETVPYSRSIYMVRQGHADCWVGSYKNEQEFAIYPKTALDCDEVSALTLKQHASGIKNYRSLHGKSVGWLLDYNYDRYIPIQFVSMILYDRRTAFNMIQKGDLDVYLDDAFEIRSSLEKLGFAASQFSIKPLLPLPIYLGFSPTDKGKQLRDLWDESMQNLHESGELKRFYQSYDATGYYPFEDLN